MWRALLFGHVGRELVNLISAHGPYAVGITGEEAQLLTAVRRSVMVHGRPPTSGWSATSRTSTPRRSATLSPNSSQWSRQSYRTPTARSTTSMPTPPQPRWRRRHRPRSYRC